MLNIPVKAWITEYRARLLLLAGAKLSEGCMMLLAAWELSSIVSGIFLERCAISEAAPHFGVLLFAVTIKALSLWHQKNICARLSHDLRLQLRENIHAALLQKADDPGAESIHATAIDSVDALDAFFRQVLPLLFSAGLLLPLYLIAVAPADPPTALLFLLTLPISPLLLYLIGRVTKSASQRQWNELFRLHRDFSELLQGLFTLKLFRREQSQKKRLETICRAFSDASLKVLQIAFVSAFALELITTLSIALVAVSIGLRLLAGYTEFAPAFFALLIAPEFYQPLRQGGTAFHIFMDCRAAWETICSCIKAPTAAPPSCRDRIQHPPAIRVDGLSFYYAEGQPPILKNLSFTLPANSFTVLAGASGSGKSTLLRLMSGTLPPTQGAIFLGDFPLQRIAPENMPRHISYVPQEPHVFSASLRDNAALFRPMDEQDIRAALEQAGLGNWLRALPHGLETPLGEGGSALSNGQRHRLGLARAILQNAPVVLLDEVTAGLDEATEQQVIEFLRKFSHRRTILFASHRPAVLAAFPNILRLDGGQREIKEA